MSKKIVITVLVLFIAISSFAQSSINDYKYVVVPLQFDFLKGKDTYRTSTLLRYLFKKEGFEVYFDEEELPKELFNDRCLALYADVIKLSGLLRNKVQIELKDCRGSQVLLSQEGSTKIKEYNKAYPVAIKEAFKSIEFLQYKYNPSDYVGSKAKVISKVESIKEDNKEAEQAKAEVERLKKEVENLKKQKALADAKTKEEAEKKSSEIKQKEKQKMEVTKTETLESSKPKNLSDVLYAQPLDNGFQLVDASPKVVMVIIKTAAPNVYTVKGKDAIVFREGDIWFYSENDTKKALNIKF
ncbi:hypothetical protein [Winogradskyella jejuensis]|uniref:Uncharacterized protein n=1 Tax=Winogradskyella jejuensis TaxID=1089305 RepID=A0A1M5RMN4_9FLAO|nr:hypothetical protein [Winogradskyella jejuensis]SHH27439.1 hypothetical protein SAMN05444148_1629 [Winogradskyella jejuensis]